MKTQIALLLAGLAGLLSGCLGGFEGDQTPVGHSRIRFVQAAADVPFADVWVDGCLTVGNLAALSISAPLTFADGSHEIGFSAAGSNPAVVLVRGFAEFSADSFYSVVLSGAQGSYFASALTTDTISHAATEVRLFHLIPFVSALDLSWGSCGTLAQSVPFQSCTAYNRVSCQGGLTVSTSEDHIPLLMLADSLFHPRTNYTLYLTERIKHQPVYVLAQDSP